MFDQLLEDTGGNLFDAVMVYDLSRWSRDNRRSKEGLEKLKQNRVRFFMGTMEYDLFSPDHSYMLGIGIESSEHQAASMTKKAIEGRIAKAKLGFPTIGNIPYGRTFNKKTGKWSINKGKRAKIIRAAKAYIDGESLDKIARKLNMAASNLRLILNKRSGDTWGQTFRNKRLNIDEIVTTTVPRLLPERTIKAIHKRARANSTYVHGQLTHDYLLGRMVFCGHCGYALAGATMRNNKYYQHPYDRGCKRTHFSSIRADILEDAVFTHLFSLFGDKIKMEQAAMDAIPNLKEIKRLRSQVDKNQEELVKIDRAVNRLLDQVEEGTFDEIDIKGRMTKNRERQGLLKDENAQINSKLSNMATEDEITERATLMLGLKKRYFRSIKHLEGMSFDEKRRLLQNIFAGEDLEGRRFGVSVEKRKNWIYIIRGMLVNEVGGLPMGEDTKGRLLGLSVNNSIDKQKTSTLEMA